MNEIRMDTCQDEAEQAEQAPREWRSLTKAEIKVLWNAANSYGEFAQLIEAKLKEKNR